MRKTVILLGLLLAVFSVKVNAQQNLFGGQDIESAVVNEDNSVTFRLIAPDAKSVSVAGDFAQVAEENPVGGVVGTGLLPMTKDADGMWSYTTKPLKSEMYMYLFDVDGVATIDINNPYVYRDYATVSNIFVVGNGQGDLYEVNDVPHGSLAHHWYDSKALETDRRINVYTPPGYESSNENYPVLYLLHGFGGDEDEWVSFGRATQILDNLIAQGTATPMIVVMPNGHTAMEAAPGESSMGFYKPGREKDRADVRGAFVDNFHEIIDFVESNYRVKEEKAYRAIAGLSMGGGHAINISRTYENKFDYVGVFSSAAGGEDEFDASLKKQIDNGVEVYWLGVGREDFLLERNQEFRAKLDKLGLDDYIYMETGNGHVWKCWRLYLSEFAPLLFKR
ncbi:alpha/beta hydrolase-fold protein [uncultured Draconibacterium sp.]|uniref:esterase n=1 Tax=uncultured Draconibacterium sp. TaxID=1573823 RepID=UPI002AA7B864|nr:alpha/beta hydrolase-fold protein [uncultured Draconibacterium sp.]